MEENDLILLKNSKKHIVKAGKWLNIFSIFAAIGVLFLVVAGVALLFFSGKLDEATVYYVDNILGFAGLAIILFAAAAVPSIVYMRRAVHAAYGGLSFADSSPLSLCCMADNSVLHSCRGGFGSGSDSVLAAAHHGYV